MNVNNITKNQNKGFDIFGRNEEIEKEEDEKFQNYNDNKNKI